MRGNNLIAIDSSTVSLNNIVGKLLFKDNDNPLNIGRDESDPIFTDRIPESSMTTTSTAKPSKGFLDSLFASFGSSKSKNFLKQPNENTTGAGDLITRLRLLIEAFPEIALAFLSSNNINNQEELNINSENTNDDDNSELSKSQSLLESLELSANLPLGELTKIITEELGSIASNHIIQRHNLFDQQLIDSSLESPLTLSSSTLSSSTNLVEGNINSIDKKQTASSGSKIHENDDNINESKEQFWQASLGSQLPKLQELDLGMCKLRYISAKSFGKLTELKKLKLDGNELRLVLFVCLLAKLFLFYNLQLARQAYF